jgi:hypothetical protein
MSANIKIQLRLKYDNCHIELIWEKIKIVFYSAIFLSFPITLITIFLPTNSI